MSNPTLATFEDNFSSGITTATSVIPLTPTYELDPTNFSATATSPLGEPLTYTWNFGDGTDAVVRNLVMQLSPIYEQRLAEATQQGQRIVVENLLRVRFGTLDNELQAIIEPIFALPPEEFGSLLLQLSNLSREDLLARFTQQ